MRCFVPNCENTEGVPFPEDQELRNVWLKSLNIKDITPEEGHFVCLDHFERDEVEESDNLLERRVLPNAVPKLFAFENVEKASFELSGQKIDSPQNDSESSNFYIPINEESSTLSEDIGESSDTHVQKQIFQNDENSESNLDNTVQEDSLTAPEEATVQPQQGLSDEANTLNTETEVFQNYEEELLEENYLESSTSADENKDQENQETENNEFLSVQSEYQTQDQQTTFVSENDEVFVAEGQNIFTTEGGQHVYVAEGQTILTSEGQQVYVTEGQAVFTANGQQVFVPEGQTLITQDGQTLMSEGGQVFLEQGEQFDEQANFVTANDSFQNTSGQKESSMELEQISDEQAQNVQNDSCNEDMEVQQITKQEPDVNLLTSQHLIINEQFQTDATAQQQEEEENQKMADSQAVEPAAKLVIKKEVMDEESSRNIVMEWFVPEGATSASESETNFSGGAQSDKITISYPSQLVAQQQQSAHAGTQAHAAGQQRLQGVGQQRALVVGGQQRPPLMTYQRLAPGKKEGLDLGPGRKRIDFENLTDHCRLCGAPEPNGINILDNIKSNIMILEAIQLCIHPLEVSLEDPFSKKICIRCFDSLQKYFEFRQKCLEMSLMQKKQYEKAHPQHKFAERPKPSLPFGTEGPPKRTHLKTIISPSKTGYRQTEVVTYSKKGPGTKNITRKIILTPSSMKRDDKLDGQNVRKVISRTNSKFDNIQVFKTGTSTLNQNGAKFSPRTSSSNLSSIPVLSPKKFSVSQIEALARKPPLSPEKQLKVQEELKKVIEGKMSKDEISVDQIIIKVVSDDEAEDPVPVKRRKVSLVNTSVSKSGHSKMRIGSKEVVIPKGIRVTIPDRFESSKGVFACFKKFGAFDTEFSLIDGYLFEHRLRKGRERFLKCLAASCPARATQRLLTSETFEGRATVTVPHNHHPLTSTEIKKQMFYYIMKKKMQADRGMNFRNIYDQICKKDPEIAVLVPLRSLINEICKHQITQKIPAVNSFDDFYSVIEDDALQKYQFTYSGKQFYQERFEVEEDGTKAVVFANRETIKKVSNSKLMYVDASFRIEPSENFSYQLVTVLVWIDDSYYPIMFALVSNRTMEIFKKVFGYLHDKLAPDLCPEEIVTDYEANIYYALGETYLDSHIGGSVFYYTQNLYKKICELGLSKELETTSYFRNIYHMLLMLPLLPVNTISDGLQNIEIQANDLGISDTTKGLFAHIKEQWMDKVTPDLFCVHRLENRINENVIAPFKKLRDFLMLNKGKLQRQNLTLINVVEKLIELENFLQTTYSSDNKKSFGRDLSSSQKKNVLKAWHFIESHPKININNFFAKVIGYIKCMENQLWIWGYYKFSGRVTDDLINASNFSIVNTNEQEAVAAESQDSNPAEDSNTVLNDGSDNTLVMEAVVGPTGEFVLSHTDDNTKVDSSFLNYVYDRESE